MMKKFPCLLLLFAIGIFTACTSTKALYQVSGNRKLVAQINKTIRSSGLKANLGIKVVSLKTGKTLYDFNGDHYFTPASNNKLYTAATALKLLTPQYRFNTTVWIDSSAFSETKVNRLTLKGGGDPDLMPDDLARLAENVSETIRIIDTLVLDNSLLDTVRSGPGWMWDEGSDWYFAQVDALTLNDNCVDIHVKPGALLAPPVISVYPNTTYVTINNQARTVADTTDFLELKIERRWWNASNTIDITGDVVFDADESVYYVNVNNPALFTGRVFAEQLEQLGTEITGPVIVDTLRPKSRRISTYTSLPLTNTIINFLKTSDNLTGELLLKLSGQFKFGAPGTWDKGVLAVKTFLKDEVGIDTSRIRLADGSGVSRYNLTTPDQLVRLLTYVYHDYTLNAEFLAALPTGGWDGTLKNRMLTGTTNRRIRAKTGTLEGVSCLSGYAFTRNNEPLAFSIMINGYVGDADPYRRLQDDICSVLVNFTQ
ncbi:MAG: D-alanyl-D-alanine carboxypeptidase/D-alanyl-D-alanine-endopeptidase [FCB group bacterium]|nr:D-alanyl-D-alanine carboxypeptidase/D-alanyl-D-alanine-endopeptidase [FCB group bacterium]